MDLRNVCSKKLGCKLKLWRQDISRASRFPIVLFWPRKTIVHNMSLLTWLNISQAKLLYEILQIRFNGRRFAPLYYTNHHLTLRNYTETRYPTNLCLKMFFEQLLGIASKSVTFKCHLIVTDLKQISTDHFWFSAFGLFSEYKSQLI